jgi:hypothetical protein
MVIVLVTKLRQGQHATVLQLPAETENLTEAKPQEVVSI